MWTAGKLRGFLRRPAVAYSLGAVLIGGVIVALALYAVRVERLRYEERALITTRNTARLLEASLTEALEKTDLNLQMVAAYFEEQSARGMFDAERLDALLARLLAAQPELESLRVIDAEGLARFGPGVPKDKPVSFADRAYFQFARDHPEAGLVVSKPTLGRITGKWSIAFSRRINGPDGRFSGMVSAIWSTRSFSTFVRAFDLGPNGQASVRHEDATLVYRYPEPPDLEQVIGDKDVSGALGELIARQVGEATYSAVGVDGIERISTVRRVREFPLLVVVGVSRQDYLPEWKHTSGALILISLGVLSMVGVGSQRLYRASMKLSDSEARWHFALEGSDHGVWDWDILRGKTYFSPRYIKLLGCEAHEFGDADTEWSSRVHPDDLPGVWAKVEQHFRERTPSCPVDFRMRRKDGRYIWIASRGILTERTPDGRPKRMIGTIADITAQREMEGEIRALNLNLETRVAERTAALDRALVRLRLATEAGELGVWAWDFASDRLEWDQRVRDWYQASDEVIARGVLYDFWRSRVHPEDLARAEDSLARARAVGGPFNEIFRLLLPGGRVLHIHAAGVIDVDEKGQPRGMVGINRDVTQQVTLEASLVAAKEAAEAANLTKSRFLANMSHEIRTPLNAMIGLSAVLKESALGAREQGYLRKISQAGQGLLGLLNDILDHSKIEAGLMQIECAPFSLGPLIERCRGLFAEQAEAKSLLFEVSISPEVPPMVLGDALRLQQVINNLLGNAIKFTERGKVSLCVACAESPPGEVVLKITVSDTGVGLSPDQISRLFQPFVQADTSTTRRYGGTGLGLSIAKRLVELMGGSIGVESQLGEGSVFWLTARLGLVSGAPPAVVAEVPPSPGVSIREVDQEALLPLLQALGESLEIGHPRASDQSALIAAKLAGTTLEAAWRRVAHEVARFDFSAAGVALREFCEAAAITLGQPRG